MSKHTKGPWTVDKQVNGRGDATISIRGTPTTYSTTGNQVCEINQHADRDGSNAALIAAAPDMLEALEAVLEWIGDTEKVLGCEELKEGLLNTIKKAEGG